MDHARRIKCSGRAELMNSMILYHASKDTTIIARVLDTNHGYKSTRKKYGHMRKDR